MSKNRLNYQDLPPKIKKLIKEPYIQDINDQIMKNTSLRTLQDYCKVRGLTISTNYLSKYRKYLLQSEASETFTRQHLEKTKLGNYAFKNPQLTKEDKLKSDLDIIDHVIQTGAKQFKEDPERQVNIDEVFKAIDLKNKITGGSNYNLTNYGIKHLTELTEAKYTMAIQILLSYVPKDKQKEAIKEMEKAEEHFYSQTEYYEDFLKAKGYTEKEIRVKLYDHQSNTNS